MSGLTLDELAARGGSSPDRVRRLMQLGVLTDRADGGFELADAQRVRLAEALDRAGIPFDALGEAVARGALSFDFVGAVLPALGVDIHFHRR